MKSSLNGSHDSELFAANTGIGEAAMAKKATRTKAAKKSVAKKKPLARKKLPAAEKSVARRKSRARTEFLFVQTARDVELVQKRRDKDAYTLTLRGLESTAFFSDRPVRLTGHETPKQFVANWAKGPNSFAENPPNAELVIFKPGKAPSAVTLRLTNPEWQPDVPNRLSYTATFVGEGASPNAIAGGSAALFIDPGGTSFSSGTKVPWDGNWHYNYARYSDTQVLEEGQLFPYLYPGFGLEVKVNWEPWP